MSLLFKFKELHIYLLYKVCKYIELHIYFLLYTALFNLVTIQVEGLLVIYIVYGFFCLRVEGLK